MLKVPKQDWNVLRRIFKSAFPETKSTNGILESPIREIPNMKALLEREEDIKIPGKLYIKLDSHLPISGSIKARGGIYEMLICGPVWLGLLIPDDNREKTEELGRPEELVCKRLAAGVKNFRDAV